MKTSTPTFDGLARKRRSLIQADTSFIALEQNAEVLESELHDRRLEAINKSSEVRKSAAGPLLDLQHYKDCIKLSAENKINSKNAFSLLLIDLMAAMTKKKDSEINKNFQVASCTLDASVKIYGYRVDAVHTDVMKMAVGFGNKQASKTEDEGENNGDEAPTEDGADFKTKLKKKKKKATLVKPETLNCKSDTDVLLDITPRQNLFTQKSEFNSLLLKIPRFNDTSCFILDPNFPLWPFDDNEMSVPEIENDHMEPVLDIMKTFIDTGLSESEHLCTKYRNFEFGKNYEEDCLSDNEMDLSQGGNQFEFDMNASVHDAPGSELDESFTNENKDDHRTKVNVPLGGYDSGEEIVVNHPCKRTTSRVNITDMKKKISMNTLEYSLFDENIFKSWAGPTYWKVRPSLNKNNSDSNKENEEGSKQVASKRTRKGRQLPPAGLFEVSWETLTKHLSTGEKTILAPGTMHNWDANNTMIPKDCKYKSKNLFTLFHIPSIIIEPKLKDGVIEESYEKEDSDEEMEDEPEELEYCSSLGLHLNEEDVNTNANQSAETNEGHDEGADIQQWDNENMVAVPNKVEKIVVSSFKRVKHIDIKHLKKLIWNILLSPESAIKKTEKVDEKMTSTLSFKQFFETCPKRMPSSLISNLSAPLIFNALLHLTNEKCLILKQDKDLRRINFEISQ